MIEVTLKEYIEPLIGVPVYMEKPVKAPAEYILISRGSHSIRNVVKEESDVTVRSYSTSKYGASAMNDRTRDLIMHAPNYCLNVFKVRLQTDYDYTDPDKKEYIWASVYDITYQEA